MHIVTLPIPPSPSSISSFRRCTIYLHRSYDRQQPRDRLLGRDEDGRAQLESDARQTDAIIYLLYLSECQSLGPPRRASPPPLVVPDSVHAKPRLWDATPRDAPEELVLPPVYLDPPFLVVRDGEPLLAPVARCHRIAVPATRRRRVETNLLFDRPAVPHPERRNVALQVEAVGPARREQVPSRLAQRAHVAAVHGVRIGDAGRDQRVRVVRVHRHVCRWIDHVFAEPVARLHERVQVLS